MVTIKAEKNTSEYHVSGDKMDIAIELTAIMHTLERILIEDCDIGEKIAPAMLISAYTQTRKNFKGEPKDD